MTDMERFDVVRGPDDPTTHHCEHGQMVQCGPNDWEPDVECCICCGNPCPKANNVQRVLAHETAERERERERYRTEIAQLRKHGKFEEAPF